VHIGLDEDDARDDVGLRDRRHRRVQLWKRP
jgi:hypothetical protein